MGADRTNVSYYVSAAALAADAVVADLVAVPIRYNGYASIQVKIDNGAGADPSDAPQGAWELYASGNGIVFDRLSTPAIDAELARISPNGNNVVQAFAVFDGMPGTAIKLRYKRTSGGAGNSRVTANITTW